MIMSLHLRWLLLFVMLIFCPENMEAGLPSKKPPSDCQEAICEINNGTVNGVIHLKAKKRSVTVNGDINGLSGGLHGFHVHESGDLSNNCLSAGPHYNPFKKLHGAPTDEERHVGDLGNIVAENDGVAHVDIVDLELRLSGPLTIVGRSIVVHAKLDDLGRGGNEESKKTGNAGPRIGCCVIVSA